MTSIRDDFYLPEAVKKHPGGFSAAVMIPYGLEQFNVDNLAHVFVPLLSGHFINAHPPKVRVV
jgi:hypothetical protein